MKLRTKSRTTSWNRNGLAHATNVTGRNVASRLLTVGMLALLLSACGGGGGSAPNDAGVPGTPVAPGAPAAPPAVGTTTVGGSIGDGPISGAHVIAIDSSGHTIAESTSDSLAHYDLEIPDDAKFPVTIKASGGIDLVTGRPPEFEMTSVIASGTQSTANVTPISSMIVRTANCRSGGLTASNVASARQIVADQLSAGLDGQLVPDAIGTPLDDSNVAGVVKANQVMAEILTRTTSTLQRKGRTLTIPEVIEALACDLSDGDLDGQAASGGISEVSTIAQAAIANVLTEALSNQLQVSGADAHLALDTAIHSVAPSAPESANTDAVKITPQVAFEARKAIVASLPLQSDDATLALAAALEDVVQPISAAALTDALPADAAATSAQILVAAQSAPATSSNGIAAQLTPAPGVARNTKPALTLTADAAEVASGGKTTIRWTTTNATSCVGVRGITGVLPINGSRPTASLTQSTTFTLTCLSNSGSTTASVTVNQPAVGVAIAADKPIVNRNEKTTLRWSSNRATLCTASGAWSGSRALSGTALVGPIANNSAFTLTCTDGSKAVAQTATVRIAAPVVTLTPARTLVDLGAPVAMTWSSLNATSCTASGGWTGSKPTSGSASLPAITKATQYILSCTGPAGSASKTVTVSAGLPSLTLTANTGAVDLGGSAVLTWHAANTKTCTASGAWTGARGPDGPATLTNVRANGTYQLTCSGTGGSIARSVTVNIKAPAVALRVDRTSVASGQGVSLNWTSTNATACTASGGWAGARAVAGSFAISSVKANSTFALQCDGPGGHSTASAVAVTIAAAKPTASLTASSDIVSPNGTVTLSWTSGGGGTCAASSPDTRFNGAVAASGSLVTSPITTDRTFTLTCTNAAGKAVTSASVAAHGTNVSWTPPTLLNNGAQIEALRGFNIYYGRTSGKYDKVFQVFDGAARQQLVPMGAGTWFVAVTALTDVTSDANVTEVRESDYSNEVQKVVQ